MRCAFFWLRIFVCLVLSLNEAIAASRAKITLKVIDEGGIPASRFPVNAGFYNAEKFQGGTDTNGCFVLEGLAGSIPEVNWSLQQAGFYFSRGSYHFKDPVKDGCMQPWDPVVTTVVRRVVDPIPLYAKMVQLKIPKENIAIGYDLFTGDWQSPYGLGQKADFIVSFSRRVKSDNDYEGSLQIIFSQPLDGIIENHEVFSESVFAVPRYAPQTGYESNWVYRIGKNPKDGYFGPRGLGTDKSYFFRVRSVIDKDGKLKEAVYGKISGQIRVVGVARKTGPDIVFTYYLNPKPNDMNLEFDPNPRAPAANATPVI